MSKNISTKDLILSHAIKLFNERGIEYVGVREIAKDLNMRVGNVTYYFPQKDDIVEAIATALAELNNKTIVPVVGQTMEGFLKMYQQIFENHYIFRCLFFSFIHHLEKNPRLERSYQATQQKRFHALSVNIRELSENKYLKSTITKEQIDYLVSALSLTGRFWLAESRVRFKGAPKHKMFKHYLTLVAHHLSPFATAKGLKELNEFVDSLE